jgi:hypothetical protein
MSQLVKERKEAPGELTDCDFDGALGATHLRASAASSAGEGVGVVTPLSPNRQRYFEAPATARSSWALVIFERPSMPSFFASL